MATSLFREYLGRGGPRILESGCGTGRWMSATDSVRETASSSTRTPMLAPKRTP